MKCSFLQVELMSPVPRSVLLYQEEALLLHEPFRRQQFGKASWRAEVIRHPEKVLSVLGAILFFVKLYPKTISLIRKQTMTFYRPLVLRVDEGLMVFRNVWKTATVFTLRASATQLACTPHLRTLGF